MRTGAWSLTRRRLLAPGPQVADDIALLLARLA